MMGGERPRPREGVRYLLGGVSGEPGAPGIGDNGTTNFFKQKKFEENNNKKEV